MFKFDSINIDFLNIVFLTPNIDQYSQGLNTEHLNYKSNQKPNVLKAGNQMVGPFENQTFLPFEN